MHTALMDFKKLASDIVKILEHSKFTIQSLGSISSQVIEDYVVTIDFSSTFCVSLTFEIEVKIIFIKLCIQ